ncbi:unnamed protein product [Rotaria sp. Silwood1]|nr:unnamed protein product [Rotaria sp. Silwood1]CAF3609255.1 unnamed protein product [Rotaria sp. Silwood1]CAF3665242.1 unnamed protein product [Rotaria sp. Silwood1]CAF4869357.1 unnamed protein product [Rotaria sp. Silwood1]
MIIGQVLLGLTGLGLSIYAYYVKQQLKKNPKYKALCDLGPNISCTKAFSSKYGTGFGLSSSLFGENSIMNASNVNFGIGFYIFQIISGLIVISLFNKLALFSSVLSCISSIYLAYILAFILKDFCLVCVTSYIINFGLLWSNIQTVYSK